MTGCGEEYVHIAVLYIIWVATERLEQGLDKRIRGWDRLLPTTGPTGLDIPDSVMMVPSTGGPHRRLNGQKKQKLKIAMSGFFRFMAVQLR
jgi:hypothetical protein